MFESIPLDVDDLVLRYRAGESPREMAETVAASAQTIRRRLQERGELMAPAEGARRYRARPEAKAQLAAALQKRWEDRVLDEEAIVAAYVSGKSATTVRAEFHTDLSVLRRILEAHGVEWRDKSAAGYVRVEREGPDVIAERHARGVAKLRGVPKTNEARVNIAKGKQVAQVKVGQGERELAAWLADRRLPVIGQLAVGRYNLDLAAAPVDIEVHRDTHHPMSRDRLRTRVAELAGQGWLTLYVWVTPPRPVTEQGAAEVVRQVEIARRDPSAFGTHQVIYGDGAPAPQALRDQRAQG